MEAFLARVPMILDELIRRDGLQEHTSLPQCSSCAEEVGAYKCIDCLAPILRCASCIIYQHENLPLHRLEVRFIFPQLTSSHVRLGLEWRVLRADIPQRHELLFLSQSSTHILPIIGFQDPGHPRNRHQWNSPRQRTILYLHGVGGMG